ncbi:MAG: hypothetical protein ACYDBQ_02475 [Thermoplasmatota archaeon]
MTKTESPGKMLRRVDPQFRIPVPPEVRKALKLRKDDFVLFTIEADGAVRVRKAKISVDD